MVDIHSHVLNEIDDGSRSFEESVEILKKAIEKGVTHMVATPHYITGSSYVADNETKFIKVLALRKYIKENNLPLELYLGNEVFVDNNMLKLLEDDKISTLNVSKYLLFEIPRLGVIQNLKSLVFELRRAKIIPIIAHPERYEQFEKEPELMEELIRQGALFQGNLGSLLGNYGKQAHKNLERMLKRNMIHFMATDAHRPTSLTYEKMDEALSILEDLVGKEKVLELTEVNPLKVIQDEVIEAEEVKPLEEKKGLVSKLFKRK